MSNFIHNQRFSHPILGGLISALLFSFLSRIIDDLAMILALVPLFVVALLHSDLKKLGPAVASALLNVGILSGLEQLLSYILYVAVPGIMLPRLALQHQDQGHKKTWYPLDRLIGALGLYALVITLGLALVWHLTGAGEESFATLQTNFAKTSLENQDRIQLIFEALKRIWPYIPGFSMAAFILMTAFSASLTQRWFAGNRVDFPRPRFELATLCLPWWCWKAIAALGVVFALSLQTQATDLQAIFGCLTLPLIALFILQGLAILTTYAKKQKNPKMILVIFYGFVLVFGWTLLILILAGLLEPWLDLRTRMIQTNKKE